MLEGPIEERPKPRARGAPIRGRGAAVDCAGRLLLSPIENGDICDPPGMRFSPEFGRKSDFKSIDRFAVPPSEEPDP